MIAYRKASGLAAALALGAGLCACVTVFPKTKPAQLYSFGETPPPAPAGASGAAIVNVMRVPTVFPEEAAGDRILTIDGREAAYIASARWVSPASVLFEEAEARAFTAAGPVRMLRRGDMAAAPYSLRLDVQTFETRYVHGPGAAPTVVVALNAELFRAADRNALATQAFEVEKPAGDNRVGAIVAAYDAAVSDVLGQVTAWTAKEAAAPPQP
jgi:cholesterol transport system auxiliary component